MSRQGPDTCECVMSKSEKQLCRAGLKVIGKVPGKSLGQVSGDAGSRLDLLELLEETAERHAKAVGLTSGHVLKISKKFERHQRYFGEQMTSHVECDGRLFAIEVGEGMTDQKIMVLLRKCAPVRAFTDGGPEFEAEFEHGLELDGTFGDKAAAYAPWQNGLTERKSGVWKVAFQKAMLDSGPRTKQEIQELVDNVNIAVNTMTRKDGYSPCQHLFGRDLRVPGMISTEYDPVINSGIVQGESVFERRMAFRNAARKAFLEADSDNRLRKALEHRTRPERGPFLPGSMVYFFENRHHWHGPAVVIGGQHSKIWIAQGTKVYRCCPEQLRKLTVEQEATIKLLPADVCHVRHEVSARGAGTYHDISNQEKTPDDADQEAVEEQPVHRLKAKAKAKGQEDPIDDATPLTATQEFVGMAVVHIGQVKEEERELLRGFRKIVRRERGSEDTQLPAEIFVVEKRQKLRDEAEELCRILSYPCQTFNSFSRTMEALAEASQETIQRVVSLVSRGSAHSMVSTRGADLLEGRPGDKLPDWRCRALCTTGRGAGNVMIERPTQIVFLGMAWLSRGLPEEWQQQGVYVVLITEADEFEEVGRQLLASGEGEIREKLRAKGICDYLIHPLSLDSLSKVVSEAVKRRLEEYLLLDILGRGATACVHKAKRLRDNETIALKEINMRRLKNANEEIERELRLLRELSWPTVVFTLDTWENRSEQLRYVVMPLLDGGSLLHRIEAARGAESEEVQHSVELVADWYVQTLHGLAYLHWRGVVHRDIKPGNLLIAEDSRLLQIGDLGSAMLLPGTGPFPNPHAKVVAPVTSPSYASPEALLQETHFAASDLWCVGVSFFEALTLHPIFPDVQSMAEAQDHVRAFDPSMAGPTNGATNYAVAALSTLNQLRCSSSSSPAAVELAGELPELVRPDWMQRPTASGIASRYFCMKRIKTILKETGAVPKGMVSTHMEDYKALLKQSQALARLQSMNLPLCRTK
eukprot:s4730_g2.t1